MHPVPAPSDDAKYYLAHLPRGKWFTQTSARRFIGLTPVAFDRVFSEWLAQGWVVFRSPSSPYWMRPLT